MFAILLSTIVLITSHWRWRWQILHVVLLSKVFRLIVHRLRMILLLKLLVLLLLMLLLLMRLLSCGFLCGNFCELTLK